MGYKKLGQILQGVGRHFAKLDEPQKKIISSGIITALIKHGSWQVNFERSPDYLKLIQKSEREGKKGTVEAVSKVTELTVRNLRSNLESTLENTIPNKQEIIDGFCKTMKVLYMITLATDLTCNYIKSEREIRKQEELLQLLRQFANELDNEGVLEQPFIDHYTEGLRKVKDPLYMLLIS